MTILRNCLLRNRKAIPYERTELLRNSVVSNSSHSANGCEQI